MKNIKSTWIAFFELKWHFTLLFLVYHYTFSTVLPSWIISLLLFHAMVFCFDFFPSSLKYLFNLSDISLYLLYFTVAFLFLQAALSIFLPIFTPFFFLFLLVNIHFSHNISCFFTFHLLDYLPPTLSSHFLLYFVSYFTAIFHASNLSAFLFVSSVIYLRILLVQAPTQSTVIVHLPILPTLFITVFSQHTKLVVLLVSFFFYNRV